jgi:hypothetical protein
MVDEQREATNPKYSTVAGGDEEKRWEREAVAGGEEEKKWEEEEESKG